MCECKMKRFPWGRTVLRTAFLERLCPNAAIVMKLGVGVGGLHSRLNDTNGLFKLFKVSVKLFCWCLIGEELMDTGREKLGRKLG